jgi:hypothetical protein
MIEKPSKEALDRLISQAVGNRSVAEWTAALLAAIRTLLLRNPKRYRGFGPYWWLVKRMFVEAGDLSFGEHLDQQWIEAMDCGEAKYNLAAAWAYEDARFNVVNIMEPVHVMIDDGDPVEFMSADEEMEMR